MKKTTFQEFLTPTRFLELKDKKGKKARSYKLGNYNLSLHNILYLEFATPTQSDGSINFINRLTNNDPSATLKGIYLLIEDKEDFPTFEDFTKSMDEFNAPLHELQILLTQIFKESIPSYGKKKALKSLAMVASLMMFAGLHYMIY